MKRFDSRQIDVKHSVADELRRLLTPKTRSKPRKSIEDRLRRCSSLRTHIKNELARTTSGTRRKHLLKQLNRIELAFKTLEEHKKQLNKAEKMNIHRTCSHAVCLMEQKYKPARKLILQETRVDFPAMNDLFNELQTELEDKFIILTSGEIERAIYTAKNKLEDDDLAGALAVAFLLRGVAADFLAKTMRAAYDFGKNSMSDEIKVTRPSTPNGDKRIINADSGAMANAYAENMEKSLSDTVRAGVLAGASIAGIVAAARETLYAEAAKEITNMSGLVVGDYLNLGRNTVAEANVDEIYGYFRSEVLDSRTCALCLSLDERVVTLNDPMAKLGKVHTHCRGVWVPILVNDDFKPEIGGIPKSVSDAFDKVDGRPITNGFKQLKKPLNDVSQDAAKEIKKRLENK